MRLAALGLVAFVLGAGPALAASAASSEPVAPDVLYLLPPEGKDVAMNLSTYPPAEGEPVPVAPFPVMLDRATWAWSTNRVPERWAVLEDDVFRLSVVFTDLEKVVPLVDAETPPEAVGKLRVRAGILQDDAFEPVYWTTVLLDPVLPGTESGPVAVVFEIPADRLSVWTVLPGNSPPFGVQIVVHGRMSSGDPVHVLVGGSEPAFVTAERFPVQAFRAWEDQERREAACNAIILEGGACPVRAPALVEVDEAGVSNGLWPAVLVAGAAMVAGFRVSRSARR